MEHRLQGTALRRAHAWSSVYIMAAVSDNQQFARFSEDNEEKDCEEKRATHDHFKEIDEVRGLINSLKDVWNDLRRSEMACERFTSIVDDYQEQPHLIDQYLEELLRKLLTIAKDPSSSKQLSREAFKYMYLLTKMRGFKIVTRLLPHEVSDMEPVLALIECQDPTDVEAWQTRYMLLVWLSIVCMIPFDLHRLDSNLQTGDGYTKPPVMERILRISQTYLKVNDKCRDAAAYLMSRFLTRPDVKKECLPEMIDWNLKIICTSDVETMKGLNCIVGSLATLALLFKQGKREDLLPYASVVLNKVASCNFMERNNSLLRKTTAKLIQRIGLIFLKQRIAAWRYQRGSRSLIDSLGGPGALKTAGIVGGLSGSCDGHGEDQDEEFEVPEESEEVIGQLLGCLKDKDTIVRWSAAKGVGRVTGRLPKELADDVVGSVLELFSYQETDGAWHGGCLTLAELGRRGLLLPQRLADVVPVVLKALLYDERRGSYSVGSHVRDAACYVCWAFARAYDPKEIVPYVNKIANALVIVSLFDREVNVRRAAAAAFQENVGRQGTFPYGIDILTTVDYYAVGICSHCYLDLSMFVAQFEEYTIHLIDHLVQVKVSHWDSRMRILTAKALHKLTSMAPDYMANAVLPALLPMTTGIDLFQRHGSIIAIAEITNALFHIQQKINKGVEFVLNPETLNGLKEIARKIHVSKLLRGHGGELMRKAVCWLIEKLSASKLPFHEDPIIDLWQELLEDCLSHTEPEVQAMAVSAIPAFCTEYFIQENGTVKPKKQDIIIKNYLSQLNASLEQTRMGFSLALGALPLSMLKGCLMDVINGLIASTKIRDKEEKMAEARRDAVKALASVCKTVGVKKAGSPQYTICENNINEIYAALQTAMTDYTMDSRGDVGSWVREAGMTAIGDLTEMVVNVDPSLLHPDMVRQIFCSLVQQSCEKIDRMRMVAGQVFIKLLYLRPEVPHVPNRADLLEIFPKEEIKVLNWALPSETFPRFAQLLHFPTYTQSTLLGLTVSVGGLTESLVKHSSASLMKYLKDLKGNKEALVLFAQALLDIFTKFQKVDRVSIPLLKMLDQLLGRQCFDGLPEDYRESFLEKLLDLVKHETARSADPHKLMAAADVYCGMLQFSGKPCSQALVQLMVWLCHRYPRVRKTTANKLYEAVLTYDEVAPPESTDEIMTLLSETRW
ncbi:hypothetical protein C0Q70_00836 [Pomacea canaliculata]|uniref:Tubulin-specific chaperone D n=2 Tax=Pomacea canaliculata TaxID=400727 RepID=A0A2T7PXR8_POMCA|nr:hypothetical protein C0Q70_00836 [Pomacea canaliculata]